MEVSVEQTEDAPSRAADGLLRLRRQELYDRVWSTPISRLAPEFGLSDVGLAKVCKMHHIPRPPVGHWARLHHGKPSHQPPLPDLHDGGSELIVITSNHYVGEVALKKQEGQPFGPANPQRRIPVIKVSSRLASPHPLVERTLAALNNARPDDYGLLRARSADTLNVAVTTGSVKRAMRILNALIKALEGHQCRIMIGQRQEPRTTMAEIDGERVPFYLKEETRREERELTPKERLEKKKYRWMHDKPKYVYHATGELALHINTYSLSGVRRRWADGKKQRLEDLLPAFVDSLFAFAAYEKQRRAEREEAEQRQQEEKKKQQEHRRLLEEERARFDKLLKEVDAWNRCRQIRDYVADVVERVRAAHGPFPKDHPFWEWVEWASMQADRLDPLIDDTKSVPDATSTQSR